jgi:hypothetical protein
MRMSFEPNRQKRQLGPGNQEEDVGFGKRRKTAILLTMTFFTVLFFYDTALFSPATHPSYT